MAESSSACCPTPKIFVGQIPQEVTQEDVHQIFSLHGPCTTILITDADGRSKGCGMVIYESWTDAERAVDDKHGKCPFGGKKPLTVRIADPPKSSIGITPKKLFIGHVPSTWEEQEMRATLLQHGTIVDFACLRKADAPGCAFVTFSRWSECEAAIKALNRSTFADGQDPIIVKFADARLESKSGQGQGSPRPSTSGTNSNSPHSPHLGMGPFLVPGGNNPFIGSKQKEGPGDRSTGSLVQTEGHKAPPYSNNPYNGHMGYGLGHHLPQGGPYGGYNDPMLAMMTMPQGSSQWQLMNGMVAHMSMMHMNGMMRGGGPGMSHHHQGGLPYNGLAGQGHVHQGLNQVPMQRGATNKDVLAKEWKLFIGQVPFSSTEDDLWPIFSPYGNILELVILRTQGRSKGCAFLTYEAREMAESAVAMLDGRVCIPSDAKQRMLLVKFATPSNFMSTSSDTKPQPLKQEADGSAAIS